MCHPQMLVKTMSRMGTPLEPGRVKLKKEEFMHTHSVGAPDDGPINSIPPRRWAA